MKMQDHILVALICASVILAGLLIATQIQTPKAHAQTTDRSGDYVITTGTITKNQQAVLIIDAIAKRANVYLYDPVSRTFVFKAARDLSKDFGG